jgi:hypothetical protein
MQCWDGCDEHVQVGPTYFCGRDIKRWLGRIVVQGRLVFWAKERRICHATSCWAARARNILLLGLREEPLNGDQSIRDTSASFLSRLSASLLQFLLPPAGSPG